MGKSKAGGKAGSEEKANKHGGAGGHFCRSQGALGQGAGGKSCLKLGVGLNEKFSGIEFQDSAGERETLLLGNNIPAQERCCGSILRS